MHFYKCSNCNDIVTTVQSSETEIHCCNTIMEELKVGRVDASLEKHIPVVERKEDHIIVTVGEISHPMTEEHHIEWICLKTNKGFEIRYLSIEEEPTCTFLLQDTLFESVYAYCNIHGLWKNQ